MATYIALLRGINVGGHKRIRMADLRELFESLGFSKVKTYIQSGNVVFESHTKNELQQQISNAIFNNYGWEVPVLVKTSKEIEKIVEACPFSEEKITKSYFALLFNPPSEADIRFTNTISYPNETFVISSSCVYLYSEAGYGNSKCNNNFFEGKLKVLATARNYNTIMKLLELSQSSL